MERYFEINENGHNIRCKLYCRDPHAVSRVVIFCHGFAGHKDNAAAAKFADRLLSKNKDAALITFNWPCHGDDVKKKLCLADCDAYLNHVIGYAQKTFAPQALYAYATSFGGYLTLKYIADHGDPFNRTALRCPAVNMQEVLTGTIMTEEDRAKLRKGKDVPVGFDRKIPIGTAFLQELEHSDIRKREYLDWAEDLLILHGTDDTVVPCEESRMFCENNLIGFVAVEGADHRFRDPRKMDLAIRCILDFFGLQS